MGYGDAIMGSGLARAVAKRGLRAAFGDGNRIVWSDACKAIYRNNPHIARPGDERSAHDLWWIPHYKGHWLYHAVPRWKHGRYLFNPEFRAMRGQIFLTPEEIAFAHSLSKGFVLIEPNVKPRAVNKQWGTEKWRALVAAMQNLGIDVRQFHYPQAALIDGVQPIEVRDFRYAAAALTRARLAILPEGGLHHAAAAFKVKAIVIFGAHTHPRITGYGFHRNFYEGGPEGCGGIELPVRCPCCEAAMRKITVERVFEAAKEMLQ
jgi:ADP-heptose:LPS heptosyltransferase